MNKKDAALTYANWGWKVLPVVPNGKEPATRHGVKDATDDRVQVAKWWSQNPEYNIGVAAGDVSGIVVLDVDPRNGGDESWERWAERLGPTEGAQALTAGGGYHFLAHYVPGINSCKLDNGLDLLSNGRYFLVHPSTIEGRSYEWELSSSPIDGVAPATLPTEWLDACQSRKTAVFADDGSLIRGARNDGLTALAGAMRRHGLTEAEILAALSVANETRCEIPLPASEIAQITKSVCRYAPDSDIAADVALGTQAAESLLSAISAKEQEDYFFTRATSYLSQPAPLPWLIKGWVPEYGTTMVYGESGAGKTFVTLDMACAISAKSAWFGLKTKPGIVIYLAGEGNYGLRQRIAAWCKHHAISALDNLLISNKAVDLDGPQAAAKVIKAVRELTSEPILATFIDTLNNHMSGDENSAKDTRNMLNSCQIIASALNSCVILNHHLGHATEAKQRARGSSAWKAALDASILVKKQGEIIELICTKMKDAESPGAIYGELNPVPLGWRDEENKEISGAVFCPTSQRPEPKVSPSREKRIKIFERAWWASGHKVEDEKPYCSKQDLADLLAQDGRSKESIRKSLNPLCERRMVHSLLLAGVIRPHLDGWVLVAEPQASALLLACKEM